QITADYAIVTLPPPLVCGCAFDPPLPARQHAALGALTMGAATKVSLRFDRPWWRRAGRPRGFGSNLPCGAIWESGEEQRAAVLTLLGGASASASLAEAARDPAALSAMLRGLGRPSAPAAPTRQTVLPTSSATSRPPRRSMATPTGRPRAWPSGITKPVSTSTGGPAGTPSTNGTNTTL